ncbi:MAG TPA: CheR family methyltransferase [Kofleriaceae bacterium]
MTDAAAFERAVDTLLACAAEWSGFQPESVAREAVRRCLQRELVNRATIHDVLRRAHVRDPDLVRVVREAISVRETYFFRNPEHFELVATRVAGLAAGGVVRAWSAGCSTGEEAWSLAATIVANMQGRQVDPTQQMVIGTDIHAPALEQGRAGTYRVNSQRPSAPMLYPVVTAVDNRLVVNQPLREIVSFAVHDLRDPPPGEYELIFCRNVLIYFKREAAREVLARLASALVPGGLLVFGSIDVDAADLPQLLRIGRPELNVFTTRPTARARTRPTTLSIPPSVAAVVAAPAPPPAPAPVVPERALALHKSALMWIEIGGRGSAEKALVELNRLFPDYVPGILERALAHARKGDVASAAKWMSEVLKRTEGLTDDHIVVGLEELPIAFYRETARTYLGRPKDESKP